MSGVPGIQQEGPLCCVTSPSFHGESTWLGAFLPLELRLLLPRSCDFGWKVFCWWIHSWFCRGLARAQCFLPALSYSVPGWQVKKQEVMTKAARFVSGHTVFKWPIGTWVCSPCVQISSVSFCEESLGRGQRWDRSLMPGHQGGLRDQLGGRRSI